MPIFSPRTHGQKIGIYDFKTSDAAIAALSDVQSTYSEAIKLSEGVEFPAVWWLSPVVCEEERVNIRSIPEKTRLAKRLMDISVSSILLVVLSPLMLLVAVLVKLTSRGPAIYSQTRVGLNLREIGADRRKSQESVPEGETDRRVEGSDRRSEFTYGRHFTIYKFRTMTVNAEQGGAQFAQKRDVRITSIGRVLRKTRLDELPQLWNVLKGEMSLVGPRPERPEFIKPLSEKIPRYVDRLGLKPGLTGVAQIMNGYDNELEGFKRKVACDLYYLQNMSFWNDFKILIRTITVVLTGSGAL